MHDLIPLGTTLPGALTTAERSTGRWNMRKTRRARRLAKPAGPISVDFAAWCCSGAPRRCPPMSASSPPTSPASPATATRKASTIGRRAAAIGYHHKMAGHGNTPTGSEAVKAVLRGIRRTIGSAKQGKAPATADLIGQMAISPKSPTRPRILIRRSKGDQEGQEAEIATPTPWQRQRNATPATEQLRWPYGPEAARVLLTVPVMAQ